MIFGHSVSLSFTHKHTLMAKCGVRRAGEGKELFNFEIVT